MARSQNTYIFNNVFFKKIFALNIQTDKMGRIITVATSFAFVRKKQSRVNDHRERADWRSDIFALILVQLKTVGT